MKFQSKLQGKIEELEAEIRRLEEDLETEKKRFIATKVAEGWKEFLYFSGYYGSHPENGEGDVERIYLFRPEVDISQWRGVEFGHGHHGRGEENEGFSDWLAELSDEQYVKM